MTARDLPAVLALNNAHAVETSFLTPDRLAALHRASCVALVADGVGAAGPAGFVLTLHEGAAHDGDNFAWFRRRRRRFLYVDRIVVAPQARGLGLAARHYAAVFAAAADSGRDLVCCEVNSRPPNPASERFHSRRGFFVLGEADTPDGAKTLRYMGRRLRLSPVQRAVAEDPPTPRPPADVEGEGRGALSD
jgi:predicted GNAT superfamily acetyltransferase